MEGKPSRQAAGLGAHLDAVNASNFNDDGLAQAGGRTSRVPSHLRADYTSHLRLSSRTSWDGTLPASSRSRSRFQSGDSRPPSPSPPQSPVRRSILPERPGSAVSLPDHAFARPTVLADRWSYDHERMPSSPPPGSRPGTPLSEPSELPPSSPASRPQSAVFSAATDPDLSHTPSSPSLRVVPPPRGAAGGHDGPVQWQDLELGSEHQHHPHDRRHIHLLTDAELELLSHPPTLSSAPASPPAAAARPTPAESRKPAAAPHSQPEPKDRAHHNRHGEPEAETRPGCLGLCEIATAQQMGVAFGAWLLGTLTPIALGLVTGCVAALGCR